MHRIRQALLYSITFIVILYCADYLAARTNGLASIDVQPYYAIHLKNKRTEFDFNVPTQTESCVQSFAPHLGYPPCWYVKRHASKRIDE